MEPVVHILKTENVNNAYYDKVARQPTYANFGKNGGQFEGGTFYGGTSYRRMGKCMFLFLISPRHHL